MDTTLGIAEDLFGYCAWNGGDSLPSIAEAGSRGEVSPFAVRSLLSIAEAIGNDILRVVLRYAHSSTVNSAPSDVVCAELLTASRGGSPAKRRYRPPREEASNDSSSIARGRRWPTPIASSCRAMQQLDLTSTIRSTRSTRTELVKQQRRAAVVPPPFHEFLSVGPTGQEDVER